LGNTHTDWGMAGSLVEYGCELGSMEVAKHMELCFVTFFTD